MSIQSQLDQVLALKELARDIHYAIIDDGLAPIDPPGNSAMREAIERVLTPDRLAAIRAAVGGEAVVLCHRLHTPGGKWQWMNGMPSKQALDDSKNFGWEMEYAYASPTATVDVGAKDLVTVWRAMVAEADNADVSLTLKHCADELAALIGEKA